MRKLQRPRAQLSASWPGRGEERAGGGGGSVAATPWDANMDAERKYWTGEAAWISWVMSNGDGPVHRGRISGQTAGSFPFFSGEERGHRAAEM